jgi:hypothetical protein
LDPHCVKINQNAEDFLNETMFSMPQDKVDTSMGLCFYVHDYADLMKLYDELGMLKNDAFYSYSLVEPAPLLEVQQAEHYEVLGGEEEEVSRRNKI